MALFELGTFDGISMDAYDFEELTIGASASGFTAAKLDPGGVTPDKVRGVVVVVSGQPINYRIDGGTPTAAIGIPAAAGDIIKIRGLKNIQNFRAIRSGASDAELQVTYFK